VHGPSARAFASGIGPERPIKWHTLSGQNAEREGPTVSTTEPGGGPTVRRIVLGSQLRRLREAREISREEAGYHIRASESKISRLELGRVSFKDRDVSDLLTLYGVADEAERAPLLAMAREANKPGWWQIYSDVLPTWFQPFIGLEEAAALIRTYEIQFVPGLLQTEEYARAIMAQGNKNASAEVVDRMVSVRMSRQKILQRANPPRLWVVVDEAALRRPVGGPKVMRKQLESLLELVEHSTLSLQVMPFSFSGHTSDGGAFSILRFPESDLSDVVYLEHLSGSTLLEKREEVDAYMDAMNRLCVDSTPPGDATAALLTKIISET
jgi:transcriptional regulator with XRE-family HTH domain